MSRDQAIIDRVRSGESYGAIGGSLGISRQRVHQIVLRGGVVHRKPRDTQLKSQERKARIIELAGKGMRTKDIAEKIGVSDAYVSTVRTGAGLGVFDVSVKAGLAFGERNAMAIMAAKQPVFMWLEGEGTSTTSAIAKGLGLPTVTVREALFLLRREGKVREVPTTDMRLKTWEIVE